MRWLPESVRRRATSRSMRGLSSGRTTTCMGAAISACAKALNSQLPRCAVAKKHALAAAERPLEMFEAFVPDGAADTATVYAREAGEGYKQAGDREAHAVHDARPVGRTGLGERHGEILHGHAAQPRQHGVARTHVPS